MDTVNKVVDAASKAIWGENNNHTEEQQIQQSQHSVHPPLDEPASGVQGKGTSTDPFDGGNRQEQPYAPSTVADTGSKTVDGPLTNTSSSSTTTSSTSSNNNNYTDMSDSAKDDAHKTTTTNNDESKSGTGSGPGGVGVASGPGGEEHGPSFTPTHGKVSEEALKGPKTGPVREEFEFEKKMEGKASAYDKQARKEDREMNPANHAKKVDDSHEAQEKQGMAHKMKDRLHFGSATGAKNY